MPASTTHHSFPYPLVRFHSARGAWACDPCPLPGSRAQCWGVRQGFVGVRVLSHIETSHPSLSLSLSPLPPQCSPLAAASTASPSCCSVGPIASHTPTQGFFTSPPPSLPPSLTFAQHTSARRSPSPGRPHLSLHSPRSRPRGSLGPPAAPASYLYPPKALLPPPSRASDGDSRA